jgi:hypothetical protein
VKDTTLLTAEEVAMHLETVIGVRWKTMQALEKDELVGKAQVEQVGPGRCRSPRHPMHLNPRLNPSV